MKWFVFVARVVAFVSMVAVAIIEMGRSEPRPMVLAIACLFALVAAMPIGPEKEPGDSPPPMAKYRKSRAEREYEQVQRAWDESLTRAHVAFLHDQIDLEKFEREIEWTFKHRPTAKVLPMSAQRPSGTSTTPSRSKRL